MVAVSPQVVGALVGVYFPGGFLRVRIYYNPQAGRTQKRPGRTIVLEYYSIEAAITALEAL